MTRAMSALPSSFFAFCVSFMTLSAQPLVSLTFPLLLAPRPPSQPLQGRDLPRPLDHRHRRRAAHAGASGYVVLGMATTGNLGTRAYFNVAHRSGLAAHDHEVTELRGTRNAGLADDDTMPTDHHVVPDLYKIINFGAFPDHCIGEGAAVDAAVGADFHVVVKNDSADLRHLEVALGAHGKAKPVLAYAHACVQDHPVTDDGVDEAYPGGDETGAGVGFAQLRHILAIVEKRQVAGSGLGQGLHVFDRGVGIGPGGKRGAELAGQIGQPHRPAPLKKSRMLHGATLSAAARIVVTERPLPLSV